MSDLKFTEDHEWVMSGEDGIVTVGITDYAQDQLGELVFVELPEIGTYWVEILLDDDLKLRYPLRVQQVVQRPPAQSG